MYEQGSLKSTFPYAQAKHAQSVNFRQSKNKAENHVTFLDYFIPIFGLNG